jgi:glycosyltransferase involved in cell wall biosynthesis
VARIVHVVISGEMAGGQKICLDIVKDRLVVGDDVVVVAPEQGPFTEQCGDLVPVELLRSERLWDIGRLPKLIRFLRRAQADLVHTHVMVPGNILWRLASRVVGVRVLNHVHAENYFGREGTKARLVRRFDTWTASQVDCFVAVSQHTARTLFEQGYPRERVRVVYNAVPWETPLPSRVRSANGLPSVIGCVARLAESKGQRELIRAFSELGSRHASAQLWLIGKDQQSGGRFEAELRALAQECGIGDRTVFSGHRDDVKELMQRMTLLALPSLMEAFPVVLLEAMSLGVPVIATNVAGVPEIITDGETGILVPPGDVGALSRAMDLVLSGPALAASLGRCGRESVEARFSKQRMLEEMRSIYSELLGRRRAAGR